jgi:nucleoside-diphosphate-sugar epimerase
MRERQGGMNLLVFGFGYTASRFVDLHRGRFARVSGTVRSREKAARLSGPDLTIRVFSPEEADAEVWEDIAAADAVLVSVPPGPEGDPVLARFADAIAAAPHLAWIGYLSTIGVYGDQGGAWVDESGATRPGNARSQQRVEAENAWLALGQASGRPVQIFRLAGIYGLGRSPLRKLADGSARRLIKPGQVFNRIHVDDIGAVLAASLGRPRPGAIYNVSDEEPAPPQDVVAFAAALAGVAAPAEEPFETAELSPMARSFYGDNKRVRNRLIREELRVQLTFPTYREGLTALRRAGEGP